MVVLVCVCVCKSYGVCFSMFLICSACPCICAALGYVDDRRLLFRHSSLHFASLSSAISEQYVRVCTSIPVQPCDAATAPIPPLPVSPQRVVSLGAGMFANSIDSASTPPRLSKSSGMRNSLGADDTVCAVLQQATLTLPSSPLPPLSPSGPQAPISVISATALHFRFASRLPFSLHRPRLLPRASPL